MSARDTGGPAFPMPLTIDQSGTPAAYAEFGMTLRDYFAAKALPILREGLSAKYLAQRAYEIADAMLAERAK